MKRINLSPPHQNGNKALVLGAREGNIGGAIAERLYRSGWIVTGDDCKIPGTVPERYDAPPGSGWHQYEAEGRIAYEDYDACIITLGVTHMEPFREVSKANIEKVLYGSLVLPLECARRYVQARDADGIGDPEVTVGTLIFIGSYAYDHPFTHCTSYCTAKAGLNMAVQSLAWELAPIGFRVHIINPHHVQGTPMTDEVRRGMQKGIHKMTREEAEAYSRKDLRMPDLLKPSDIAEMVVTILENPVMGWTAGQPINMYGSVR
jgi:NAD(P)-dependent dehydrogenase (short-subunit alcohol dehydrogenase family)